MRMLVLAIALLCAACAGAEVIEFPLETAGTAANWDLTGVRINYTLGKSSVSPTTDAPAGMTGGLKVVCDFALPGRAWLGARWRGERVPGACRRLRFWLKGDGNGHTLLVRLVDAAGGSFERRLMPVDWTDWREVTVDLTPLTDWRRLARFGEPRDPIRFPITLDCIALGRRPGAPPAAEFTLAGVRAESDVNPVDLVALRATPRAQGGIFYRPAPVILGAAASNTSGQALSGTLWLEVTDFFGDTRRVWEQPLSLGAGEDAQREVTFTETRLGVFDGFLGFTVGGQSTRVPVHLSVSEERTPSAPDPSSPFGINFVGSFPAGPQREHALKLAAEAGIRWDRVGFNWQWLEPSPGAFPWRPPATVPGLHGQAVSFPPGSQQLTAEDTGALGAPARSGQLTLEWVFRMPRVDVPGDWHILFGKAAGDNPQREWLVFLHGPTRRLFLSSGDHISRWSDTYCDKTDWEPGRWYHVVVTHLRDTETRWYVDGQPCGVLRPTCKTLLPTSAPLTVGPRGSAVAFDLDDLRVYDRVLSPADVAALSRGEPIAVKPVAAYDFAPRDGRFPDVTGNSDLLPTVAQQDGIVRDCARYGISVLGILGFPPKWASTAPDDAERPWTYEPKPGAFEEHCRAVSAHFGGSVGHWEIWNEPNIRVFWEPQPDPAAYVRTLGEGFRGCKAGNPDSTVIGISLAGGGLDQQTWVEQAFAAGAGGYMDVLSLHPYRQPRMPEETDLIGDMRHASQIGASQGQGRRIWITEIGWGTEFGASGGTAHWQALMLPRGTIEALASGVVDKVFWFRFHDPGSDPSYIEHNYGLLWSDLSPKPGYFAHRAMALTLDGQRFARTPFADSRLRAHLFAGERTCTLAFWAVTGQLPIRIAPLTGPVTLLDIMGNPRQVQPRDGALTLTVGPEVQYLLDAPANVTVAPAASLSPDEPTLARGDAVRARLSIANPSAAPLAWVASWQVPAGLRVEGPTEGAVPAGQSASADVTFTAAPDAAVGEKTVALTLRSAAESCTIDFPVLIRQARADSPPVACFHFDEPAGDLSADAVGGAPARLLDGARLSPQGRKGGCLELTQVQSRAEVPPSDAHTLTDEATLVCWVKCPGNNGSWQWLLGKCLGERIRNYGLYLARDTGLLAFTATFADMGEGHSDLSCPTSLWDNEWHHVAVTFSQHARTLRMYVDGQQVAQHRVGMGGLTPSPAPLTMGEALGGPKVDGTPRASAFLDEVTIYARALTPEEIAAAAR
jgi:hypothetical protein